MPAFSANNPAVASPTLPERLCVHPLSAGAHYVERRTFDESIMAVAVREVPHSADPALASLLECDRALLPIARRIKVLKAIDWPPELEERFLGTWKRGQPELPVAPTQPQMLGGELDALDALMRGLDRGHPIGNWLFKTAWSYHVAARMLAGIGTPEFTRCSTLLYGRPDFKHRSQDVTNVDGAREMLAITDELIGPGLLAPVPFDIPAEAFADLLRERIGAIFCDDDVKVVLDPALSSKAAASSKRIALRATAMFSQRDLEQLLQHEAFIHTLTSLNGRHQPHLRVARTRRAAHDAHAGRPRHVRGNHHRRDRYIAVAADRAARRDGETCT